MRPAVRSLQESYPTARDLAHRAWNASFPSLTERTIRCLWYAQGIYLKKKITATDGRRLRVISPGRWNTGRGPDFIHGVFRLGHGRKLCGDVEIHRQQTDWKAHGHQADPFFRNVRLHIFMREGGNNGSSHEHPGKRMTEVCLLRQTRRGFGRIVGALDPGRYPYAVDVARGRCSLIFKRMGEKMAVEALREAGEKRLALKAARVGTLVARSGEEQAFYLLLLESLGYVSFKEPFVQLSERLPWSLLRRIVSECGQDLRKAEASEAALLGAAGLIPGRPSPEWDGESKRHWERIHRAWQEIERRWRLQPMDSAIWKKWGSRPANSPCRRLVAISSMFARAAENGLAPTLFPRGSTLSRRSMGDHVKSVLGGHDDDFWRRHYTWGGKRLSDPAALLGQGRILAIVATVLLPVLSQRGEAASARRIFNQLPAGEPNSITRLMITRLFGKGDTVLPSAGMAAQQGLIHIYKAYCSRDRSGCRSCGLVRSIKSKS